MRNLHELDSWRCRGSALPAFFKGDEGDHTCGVFVIQHKGARLVCVVSTGEDWDHVSISLHNRCPTWAEMDWLKRKFFLPHEVVIQIHPAESDHVNIHPYCLHLWRHQHQILLLPPMEFV